MACDVGEQTDNRKENDHPEPAGCVTEHFDYNTSPTFFTQGSYQVCCAAHLQVDAEVGKNHIKEHTAQGPGDQPAQNHLFDCATL